MTLRILILSLVLVLGALVSPARAGERQLGVAPAPAELTVTSTAWTSAAAFLLPGQATSTSFNGGLISIWTCAASVTVKDPAQAELKTRVLFNGAAGALHSSSSGADGSVTRVYLITNPPLPPGPKVCQSQLQLAKTSGDIGLRAADGDILKLSVPTPN